MPRITQTTKEEASALIKAVEKGKQIAKEARERREREQAPAETAAVPYTPLSIPITPDPYKCVPKDDMLASATWTDTPIQFRISPSPLMPHESAVRSDPKHPVGILKIPLMVSIPMVDVLAPRDETSDEDLVARYGPQLLRELFDAIERFRSSNEIDPVTAEEIRSSNG